MKIACRTTEAATQIICILNRHGVTRGVSWEGGSPLDARMWISVWATLGPATEAAIRRDIASIGGTTYED